MKTAIVTGANRGIGLELTRLLAKDGYRVFAVCRSSSPELSELGVEVIAGVDVNNPTALTALAEKIPDVSVDLLINNAGILTQDSCETVSKETLLQQFETNAVAPLMITQALLAKLKKGSKIAMITSRMGSIGDNSSGGYYGYRASKAALNAFSKSLSIDLKKQGIAVALLHPGYVQTRMVNFNGDITPALAASRLLERVTELTLENSGTFWHCNGEELPW